LKLKGGSNRFSDFNDSPFGKQSPSLLKLPSLTNKTSTPINGNMSLLTEKSQSTPNFQQTPKTKHLIELEDQIKNDKFSKSRVSHVSSQKSVISPNRIMKRNTTTNHFFKHGEVEIGNLKLYDHDVS